MTYRPVLRALSIGLFTLPFISLGVACTTSINEGTGDTGDSNGESLSDGSTGTGGSESASASASASGTDGTSGGTTGATSDSGDWTAGGTGGTGTSGDPGDVTGASSDSGSSDTGTDTDTGEPVDPGQLTAGEWRDLDHWDFWLGLLGNEMWQPMEQAWKYFTSQRYAVIAVADNVPVADAQVVLLDGGATVWEARTDVRGRAELFNGLFGDPAAGPFSIKVTAGGASTTVDAVPYTGDPAVVDLVDAAAPEAVLDLLFMIDTTGSMGDELAYLQAELADVIDQIRTNIGQSFKIRLSVNFYRDHGDAYLVRPFPFTENIDQALADLAAQSYDGGGDFPEAVTEALDSAIHDHDWSPSAVSRLAFLVLDAPPHDTADDIGSLQQSVEDAAQQGIRIIPVASSGVDKSTEFFLRFIDIATGGTYVFLTNDSGIGGDHIEPTIGDYQVELLNKLLVRLITQSVQGA